VTPIIALPYLLRDGIDEAKGSETYGNDNTILGLVNGNIDDDNIKVGAAIQGTKLSAVAGSRVPSDRIEDGAITTAKLASPSVVTANLTDLNVTKGKLSTTPTQKITVAQLETFTDAKAVPATTGVCQFTGVTFFAGAATAFVGLSCTPVNVAGNWQFRMTAWYFNSVPATDVVTAYDTTIDPNAIGMGLIPVATTRILSCWYQNPSIDGSNRILGTLVVNWINLT